MCDTRVDACDNLGICDSRSCDVLVIWTYYSQSHACNVSKIFIIVDNWILMSLYKGLRINGEYHRGKNKKVFAFLKH